MCNATTLQCVKAPHSGQPTKESCDASCGNHTPSQLVGLWRGLDVQAGFSIGEWVMNFTEKTVAWGPHGSPRMFEANVVQLGPYHLEFDLTAPAAHAGEVRLATYSNAGWPTGPETWSFAIAIQADGSHVAPPDNLPGHAMGERTLDLYVMHGCHEYHHLCDFSAAFASARSLSQPKAIAAPAASNSFVKWVDSSDPCLVHSSCGQCINDATNVCGWCDGTITFSDGTQCGADGAGCCGGSAGFARCDPGYRKACPVICDWNSHAPAGKHPFCREATTPEFNSSIPKYSDCSALNNSHSCDVPPFGQYCDKTAAGGRGQAAAGADLSMV